MIPLEKAAAALVLVLAGICIGMWACDKQCEPPPPAEVRR